MRWWPFNKLAKAIPQLVVNQDLCLPTLQYLRGTYWKAVSYQLSAESAVPGTPQVPRQGIVHQPYHSWFLVVNTYEAWYSVWCFGTIVIFQICRMMNNFPMNILFQIFSEGLDTTQHYRFEKKTFQDELIPLIIFHGPAVSYGFTVHSKILVGCEHDGMIKQHALTFINHH